MTRFQEALRAVRSRRGLSQVELAEKLGVKPGTVGNWEAGVNGAPRKRLKEIADKLGVTMEFLTGEPAMELKDAPSAHYNAKHIGSVHGASKIPVISFARAGAVDFDYADLDAQMDESIESDIKDPNSFGLVVEGDSMEPKISAGDIVIVAPNDRPRNGDLVVSRLERTEGVMLKIFSHDGDRIRLTSYNPAYPPLEFKEADFVFIYPVHSRITRWRR